MLCKEALIQIDNKPELAALSDYQLQKHLIGEQEDRHNTNLFKGMGAGSLVGALSGALLTKKINKVPTTGDFISNTVMGTGVGGVVGAITGSGLTNLYNNKTRNKNYQLLREQRNTLVDTYKKTDPNMYRMLKAYHKDTGLDDIVYTKEDYSNDLANSYISDLRKMYPSKNK